VANLAALKSAARAAIVMPATFAFADKVIDKPQTSILAAFGSFAVLVLVEFGGPPLTRLAAYVALALVGAAFITLGTLCSRSPAIGGVAMAAVGFATLYSGVLGGYFAAGSVSAILTFVLPVTIAAPNAAIPDRLEGWGLAAGAGIPAVMLLWPARHGADLRRDVAAALRDVADFVDAAAGEWAARAARARESVDALGRRFLGAQYRPGGPAGPTAALASLPDELDWLLSFLAPTAEFVPPQIAWAEDAEATAATSDVLRASAETLEGGSRRPDLARLDAARETVARAIVRRLPALPPAGDDEALMAALEPPFRIRVAAYSARQVAGYALRASGAALELDRFDVARTTAAHATLEATEQLARENASVASVWFQNSVRGAAGLAVAVYVAQRTGLQHGFWVVLGTLSVLRSNALGTGWSIVSALAGTAVGLVAGALLVIAIGTHEAVLWAVLPFAVLLGAYAPRAISFAAGQAGFSVVLYVLFNLIQPVGWSVGLIRVEDVAIGFGISLLVGLLFWPRGAAARLRRDVAAAYGYAGESVAATARRLFEQDGVDREAHAARMADTAVHRLDDAFRQYLTERSAHRFAVEDVAVLVGGAARVRRAAHSLSALAAMTDGGPRLTRCGRNLDRELDELKSWYAALGSAIAGERPLPPPHARDVDGHRRLIECVRDAARGSDPAMVHAAVVLLWGSQHLDNLWRLEAHLAERARLARPEPEGSGALARLKALAS
jgi:uncharacterized membrane protein YccC